MKDDQTRTTQHLRATVGASGRFITLSAVLTTLALGGCGSSKKKAGAELEVRWSVDGKNVATVCQDITVATWVVEARGGEVVQQAQLACDDEWTTAGLLEGLPAGTYTITVIGLDTQGEEVGRSYATEVILDGTGNRTHEVAMFTSIGVHWNINGTIDGTALGESWDTCAEVGAEVALITVDDKAPIEAPCLAAREMHLELTRLAIGGHTVKVRLQDGSGNDLTTEGEAAFAVNEAGTDFIVDFYYDSFFEPKRSETIGSYWFRTVFGGDTCTAAVPAVSEQVALVKLDGTPVDGAMVCDASASVCQDADGAALLPCSDGDQQLPDLTWGTYKLLLRGTVGSEGTICWETSEQLQEEIEILVGAGVQNPIDLIDLARISTEGECS